MEPKRPAQPGSGESSGREAGVLSSARPSEPGELGNPSTPLLLSEDLKGHCKGLMNTHLDSATGTRLCEVLCLQDDGLGSKAWF